MNSTTSSPARTGTWLTAHGTVMDAGHFEKGSFAAVGRGQGSADVVGELLPVPAKPHGLVLVVRVQQVVAFLSAIPSPGIVLVRCTAIKYVLRVFEIAKQNNRKPRAGQAAASPCFCLALSNSLRNLISYR